MLILQDIVDKLNTDLNNKRGEYGVTEEFSIYADGEYHKPDTFENNKLTEFLEGTAVILSDSIIPVSGLNILTQTVGVSIVKDIKNNLVYREVGAEYEPIASSINNSVENVRKLLQNYLANTYVFNDSSNTTITMTGSQPKAQKIEQRPGVGNSIEYYFTVQFVTITNGVNSTAIELYCNDEQINYSSMIILRAPQMDGGAFATSGGIVKNYMASSAFEIQLVVPAISSSDFFTRHFNYLITGNNTPFTIKLKYGEAVNEYQMAFAQTSLAVQGIDNAGQNITLIEALID